MKNQMEISEQKIQKPKFKKFAGWTQQKNRDIKIKNK